VNLPHVLHLLRDQPHLISGLPDPARPGLYPALMDALRRCHPELLLPPPASDEESITPVTKKRRFLLTTGGEGLGGEEGGQQQGFTFGFSV
jgi:hypothetical protein